MLITENDQELSESMRAIGENIPTSTRSMGEEVDCPYEKFALFLSNEASFDVNNPLGNHIDIANPSHHLRVMQSCLNNNINHPTVR